MKRWERLWELADSPPPYDGMTSREIWLHERELDRKVDNHQRFWRRVAYMEYLPSGQRADAQTVLRFQLLDAHRNQIGRAMWTRSVAYSIAHGYDWKIIRA